MGTCFSFATAATDRALVSTLPEYAYIDGELHWLAKPPTVAPPKYIRVTDPIASQLAPGAPRFRMVNGTIIPLWLTFSMVVLLQLYPFWKKNWIITLGSKSLWNFECYPKATTFSNFTKVKCVARLLTSSYGNPTKNLVLEKWFWILISAALMITYVM